jgi:hypothetical protein
VSALNFPLGLVTGLLVAAVLVLAQLIRYVQSDLDAFTRYLDNTERKP